MRKMLLLLFILITGFAVDSQAQTANNRSGDLPNGIGKWSAYDSDKILQNPSIKARLKRLLGKTKYAAFLESFETVNPIEKKGVMLFSSGCMIHACTHLESAIAIDLSKNTIHAAIFNEEKKTKYFNEKGSKTPKHISSWAKRLENLERSK